jgi:L-asparaginase/Glu-tRNA(Gln) amidotransferase subunit D
MATGGTIANGLEGRLTAQQLVDALPAATRSRVRRVESFANTASPTLDLDDWRRLAQRLAGALASSRALEGVVVTAGTDTLEELAWFLHLTIADERPVVVVGAMRRPGTPEGDGPRNLADAIAVATTRAVRGLGTLVVMHGHVSLARDVRKHHSTRLDAFDPPPGRLLATVRGTRVVMMRHPPADRLHGALPIESDSSLPRVDVLLTYQGAPGDLLDLAVRLGARGLVIAAAGAGSLTPPQAEAARRLAREGVPIVIATRTGAGPVESFDPADRTILAASNLSPVKARLTLVLGLAHRMDSRALRQLFAD